MAWHRLRDRYQNVCLKMKVHKNIFDELTGDCHEVLILVSDKCVA